MPATAQWIAAACPTRWGYEANFLKEAEYRKASFVNEMEQKFQDCRSAVARCEARLTPVAARAGGAAAPPAAAAAKIETDIAAAAFPVAEGRSTIARSFQVMGVFFATFLILMLATLTIKAPR
jgi:hypothetical protein